MSEGISVAKNTAFLTIGAIAQKLLSFVYFVLVARLLGSELTGKYLFALSFMLMFSVINDFGLQPVIIREVARRRDEARHILKNALGIKLFLSIIAVLGLVITAQFTESDPVRRMLIQLAAMVMVLDTIHLTMYGVLRGFEQLRYEAIGMVVGQVVTIIAGAVILFVKLPLPYLMISIALGAVWNVLFSSVMVARKTGAVPWVAMHLPTWKQLLRLALPFAVAAIFVRIYSSADSVMLGKILDDRAVAWYGIPYKFTFAFQFIPIALAAALFPTVSRTYAQDAPRVGALFSAAERYLMLVAFPLVIGMITLARPIILAFYGTDYLPSIPVMQILSLSLLTAFLDFPVGSLLNATHRQHIQTILMGITMTANIGLNFFLIPRFGPVGAAIAAVIGNAILFFGGLIWVPRIIPMPWKQLTASLARISISAILMGILVVLTDRYLPLAASIGAGAIVYIGMLFALGEIGRTDVVGLRKILRRDVGPAQESL